MISSRPHSRELECMVHWRKGARVWVECLAGLPWPWIKHHKAWRGETGPALEITTCDRQAEEIQEDRNNQIRLYLKWNIHSNGSRGEACLLIRCNNSPYKTELLKSTCTSWRLPRAFAVYRAVTVWECGQETGKALVESRPDCRTCALTFTHSEWVMQVLVSTKDEIETNFGQIQFEWRKLPWWWESIHPPCHFALFSVPLLWLCVCDACKTGGRLYLPPTGSCRHWHVDKISEQDKPLRFFFGFLQGCGKRADRG